MIRARRASEWFCGVVQSGQGRIIPLGRTSFSCFPGCRLFVHMEKAKRYQPTEPQLLYDGYQRPSDDSLDEKFVDENQNFQPMRILAYLLLASRWFGDSVRSISRQPFAGGCAGAQRLRLCKLAPLSFLVPEPRPP